MKRPSIRMSHMRVYESSALSGVLVLEPHVYVDDRGFFLESFNQAVLDDLLHRSTSFVQDNHSRSVRGVLRGLHYQLAPSAQGKLVRVTSGAIFDVAVDVRRSSQSFGQWVGYELSDTNFRQLWIPPGYAHGFLTLTGTADVLYKTTDYYAPNLERSIRWDDPEIGIRWPINDGHPNVSEKDQLAPTLSNAEVFE